MVIAMPLAPMPGAQVSAQPAAQFRAGPRTVARTAARAPARPPSRPADEGVPPHAVPVVRRPASHAPLAGMSTVMAGLPMLRSQAALVRQICGDIVRDWERAEANLGQAIAGCEAVRDLTARCEAAYRPDGTVDVEAYERLRAEIAGVPALSADRKGPVPGPDDATSDVTTDTPRTTPQDS